MPGELIRLSVCACEDEKPLTELRLFAQGINESSKGPVTFDDVSAQSVMAAYAKFGTDIMIDLEHLSLDSESANYNPDAMGWGKLELRGGELWLAPIKWNNTGEWRLRDKLQRYLSPAMRLDDAGRVAEIVNVALVAMPATYGAQELIAASRLVNLSKETNMDPKLITAALEALIAGDADKCAELLKSILTSAITGQPAADTATEETPAVTPEANVEASASTNLSIDTSGANLVLSTLLKTTGASDPTEALQIVESWSKAQAEVKAQKDGLELSSRRMLIASLVKLGAETPATAWEGEPDKRVPVTRLASEPLDALRARVATLSAGSGGARIVNLKPAVVVTDTAALSEKELKECKDRGLDPVVVLARKTALYKRAQVNSVPVAAGVTAQ